MVIFFRSYQSEGFIL